MARGDQRIPAVVARASDDGYADGIAFEIVHEIAREICDGAAGRFHEDRFRYPEIVDRAQIGGPHFGGGERVHREATSDEAAGASTSPSSMRTATAVVFVCVMLKCISRTP